MADSNITKRALATALRELMKEVPFEKIQVAQICERCDMNRKSFYYHFKDKYDLVNWIFDTEIIPFICKADKSGQYEQRVEMLREICDYFYANRSFYRAALKIQGQNSFSEHLGEFVRPLLKLRLTNLVGNIANDDFTLNFFADAAICSLERWLLDKNCMPPDQFVSKMLLLIERCVKALYLEFQTENGYTGRQE